MMRMSHSQSFGGAGTTLTHRVRNLRGLRECILPNGYERRVLITRKYAGIRVVDPYRFSNRLQKTL